jgi:hypothetical protein
MKLKKLNVVVKWLTLLLHIQKVPGSNLGLETGNPVWDFFTFFSVLPGKCRGSTLILGHNFPFPKILSTSSFTCHSFVWCYIVIVTEKGSLIKLKYSALYIPSVLGNDDVQSSSTLVFSKCTEWPGSDKLQNSLENLLHENVIEHVTFKQWISTNRSTLESIV